MRLLSLCLTLLPLLAMSTAPTPNPLPTAGTAQLTIRIDKIKNDKGRVLIAIYNNAASFPEDSEKAYKRGVAAIKGNQASWTVTLPKGTYAVSAFHDANESGVLEKNMLGIPKEGYGFSNNAKGMFGPPSFQQAAVQVEGDKTISISF